MDVHESEDSGSTEPVPADETMSPVPANSSRPLPGVIGVDPFA